MKLVIDRSKWLRGEGSSVSSLLRSRDGKMCCLGFFAKALGYPDACLRELGLMSEFNDMAPDWLLERDCGVRVENSLTAVNDAPHFSDFMREAFIKETFAKHGVEVEFVDAT
jgi:hypothetical protein